MKKCEYCEKTGNLSCNKWICHRCVDIILRIQEYKDTRQRLFGFNPIPEDLNILSNARAEYKIYAEAGK